MATTAHQLPNTFTYACGDFAHAHIRHIRAKITRMWRICAHMFTGVWGGVGWGGVGWGGVASRGMVLQLFGGAQHYVRAVMYFIWCACMLAPEATGVILGPASGGRGASVPFPRTKPPRSGKPP